MIKKNAAALVFSLATSFAFADVQVVDYSSDSVKSQPDLVIAPAISTRGLSIDQRINKLEQQINNINGQNFISKIDELQQRVQKQSGQLEDQEHKIEQLNSQLRSFYQDLNQRLERPSLEKPSLDKPIVEKPKTTEITKEETIEAAAAIEPAVIATKKANEIKPAPVNEPINEPRNDKAFLKEQQMYQTAIDLLPDKKYEASGSKLRDYLKLYPKGAYVANAHYWLGEINFLQKHYDAAEEEFKVVLDKYSKSKRASDAMFKLALVHQNQGRESQSKQELRQVIKRYPGTSASRLAKAQLDGNN